MRLWHKYLIPVLPSKQLCGQWRECCLIAKNIHEKGTPNHVLVNKVMRYPIGHLYKYAACVRDEMWTRGYKCDFDLFLKYMPDGPIEIPYSIDDVFPGWHTDRYYTQCICNLQEKHDCGAFDDCEWKLIYDDVAQRSSLHDRKNASVMMDTIFFKLFDYDEDDPHDEEFPGARRRIYVRKVETVRPKQE